MLAIDGFLSSYLTYQAHSYHYTKLRVVLVCVCVCPESITGSNLTPVK